MISEIEELEKWKSEYEQALRCYHHNDAEKNLNDELQKYVVRVEKRVPSKLSDLLEIGHEGELLTAR